MPELVVQDMQRGYMELVEYVLTYGRKRSPRGMPTLNVRDMTLVLERPENALTEHIGRRASTRLAALEALQLVAGESWPDLMVRVAPNTAQFLDATGEFHGSYGPRLRYAIPGVIQRIQRDPDTRQAVANIYDATRDLAPGLVDVPCNDMVMYEVEDGRLHAWTVVRSNDTWWGVAHDVFMFTVLQRTIAAFLDLEVGTYYHTAWSMHLYERDLEAVERMHEPTKPAQVAPPVWLPHQFCPSWSSLQKTARHVGRVGAHTRPELRWWVDKASTWVHGD